MFVGRLLAIWLGFACALMAQPTLTTIQDTIYKANGTRFSGSLTVSWTSFSASDTTDVAMESTSTRILDGALFIRLVPDTTSTPVNYYRVLYTSNSGEQFSELWAVPPSTTPLRVQDVRVTPGILSGSGTGSGGGPGGGLGGATSDRKSVV